MGLVFFSFSLSPSLERGSKSRSMDIMMYRTPTTHGYYDVIHRSIVLHRSKRYVCST